MERKSLLRSLRAVLVAALAAGLAWSSTPAVVVRAASITVTTAIPDANADGLCSLIEAIDNANDDAQTHADCPAGNGADVISLQAAGPYILTAVHNDTGGPNGLPSLASDITVVGDTGSPTRIERDAAAPAFRILHVSTTGSLTLRGVSLSGGVGIDGTEFVKGGGGVFYDRGQRLVVEASIITGNRAEGDNAKGGGILVNLGGPVQITGSTISYNVAPGNGGGIWLQSNFPATIARSAIFENESGGSGGGIRLEADLNLTNSTLYRNRAAFGAGLRPEGSLDVFIRHSTIAQNHATVRGGGIELFFPGVQIVSSILSENTAEVSAPNCFALGAIVTPQSLGHNLFGDMSDCLGFVPQGSDLNGDPHLGAFTDDGTPGNGHLPLLTSSPAIDAAANFGCPTTDQRDHVRPLDGNGDGSARCDIGAYEAPPAPLDDFSLGAHPGGRLGPDWGGSARLGQYRATGDRLDVEAGGPVYWVNDIFSVDQQAFITLAHVDPQGEHQSLLLKVQGIWQQGAMAVFYNAMTGRIGLETFVPGRGWRTLRTFPMTLRDGDQLGGRALPDGRVQAYVNGRLLGTAGPDPFFAGKGGRAGLWFIVAADAVLDDFSGTSVEP